jgi:hypothetical protein
MVILTFARCCIPELRSGAFFTFSGTPFRGTADFPPELSSGLLPKNVLHNISTHLQGPGSELFRVVVYIVPAIAQIRFEVVVTNQSALVQQSKTLCGLAVVFVDFGQAVVKVVFLVIDGMAER